MGFINRELKEEEQREYFIKEREYVNRFMHNINYMIKFSGGTIDDENNVRMFLYATDNSIKKLFDHEYFDSSDIIIWYGILDYKGEAIHFTAKLLPSDNVKKRKWLVTELDTKEDVDEKKSILVNALTVYKDHGYSSLYYKAEIENPNYKFSNENKVDTVEVDFEGI